MAALKLVKEHPLVGVPTVSIVGRRRSIDELPWAYRVILRWVFRRVSWASSPSDPENSHEIQMIATDEALGRAHMKPGWYIHTDIPINVLFPEETIRMGKLEFFKSPMNQEYAKVPCDTVAIKVCVLNELIAGMGSRVEALQKVAGS